MADDNQMGGGIADPVAPGEADGGNDAQEGIADAPKTEGIADEPGTQGAEDQGKSQGGKDGAKEPEPYELTAPEDFPVPEENLKSFTTRARELGLTKEQAEGMLKWHQEYDASVGKIMEQNERSTLAAWGKEIGQDKDFGGANMKTTIADARRALEAFDTDGSLRALLRDTQYQYNPAIIRAVARVGRAMGEHGFVGQNGNAGRASVPLEERMYPDMKV